MTVPRRDFLRKSLMAVGGVVAGGAALKAAAAGAAPAPEKAPKGPTLSLTPDGELVAIGAPAEPTPEEIRRGIPGRKFVMVIDLAICDGCGGCTEACAKQHFLPADRELIRLYKVQPSGDSAGYWFPRPCFHCDNPPCTRVCPVGATFKRDDGIVLIDNERCIGCRFCLAACPFSVRTFNWAPPENPPDSQKLPYSPERGYPRRIGTAEKCDFCADLARDGKLPHCVSDCDMGAMWFGDENEDSVTNGTRTVQLSKLLRERSGFRYMEELGTKPRVYYLPPTNRRFPAPGEPGAELGQKLRGEEQR